MKYIEELLPGDSFVSDSHNYLLTSDFKKNGCRLSYDLKSGNPKWFEANSVVDLEPIYILDKDNTIIAIKEVMKDNVSEN
jgi:hypothetical protein